MLSESPHPLAPLVRKLRLWAQFTSAEEDAILRLPYVMKRFEPGNYIVRDGDRPQHACLLVSGFAFRSKLVGDGGRQILAVHIPGDIVDLQNALLRIADHNVQALTNGQVAMIPRQEVQRLAFDRPQVGMAMWYDTLVDGAIHREWTANVGRRDGETRMAHLLCEFGVRLEAIGLGSTAKYDLPMTQEQLADCTGMTPVHTNRILKSLDNRGLTARMKRSVHISDFETLSKVGDFNRDYLHLERLA